MRRHGRLSLVLQLMLIVPMAVPMAMPLAAPADWAEPGLELQTLAPGSVASTLGQMVLDGNGDEIGRVVDVLVDRAGNPRAAVIDIGGFLGVGTRRVAIAWSLLHFRDMSGEVRIIQDLSQDEAAAAPEYRGTYDAVIISGRRASQP